MRIRKPRRATREPAEEHRSSFKYKQRRRSEAEGTSESPTLRRGGGGEEAGSAPGGPPSLGHGHWGGGEGGGLTADAVQPHVHAGLIRGRALQPGMLADVLQGWPVGGPQSKAPPDELLALWKSRRAHEHSEPWGGWLVQQLA